MLFLLVPERATQLPFCSLPCVSSYGPLYATHHPNMISFRVFPPCSYFTHGHHGRSTGSEPR